MAAISQTTLSIAFSSMKIFRISIEFSLKFVPMGPINDIPALVQIMAWHRVGDKPLSEPVMVILLTHICVTQPQWVNPLRPRQNGRHFAYGIFKCLFLNENVLKFVLKGSINNITALFQIMVWHQLGDKPLSKQWWLDCQCIYVSLGLKWVNSQAFGENGLHDTVFPFYMNVWFTYSFQTFIYTKSWSNIAIAAYNFIGPLH